MVVIGRRNKLERAAQDALARAEAAGAAQPASSGLKKTPGRNAQAAGSGGSLRTFVYFALRVLALSAASRAQPPRVGLNPVSALHFWSCGERGICGPAGAHSFTCLDVVHSGRCIWQ